MDFQRALVELLTEHVKVRAISRASSTTARCVDSSMRRRGAGNRDAHRLRQLLDARLDGAPRHHPILVDLTRLARAMLLELPAVLDGLIGAGPLRRLLGSTFSYAQGRDSDSAPHRHVARELPAQETIELYTKLVRRESRSERW